ncbi:MAG: hypothetical protein U0904_07280 [Candidatus Nanopelagicales bacterium]|nr:hypothetical protein [Candidatus Nanopelagicales bacterium]
MEALSQVRVAELTGMAPSNVSAYRAGRLVEGALVRSRLSLVARLPGDSSYRSRRYLTMPALATQIRKMVREDESESAMVRLLAQATTHFHRLQLPEDRDLFLAEPGTTRSQLWDACISALAERLARQAGLETPAWAMRLGSRLARWHWICTPELRTVALRETPGEFKARRVVLSSRNLNSV